MRDMERIVDPRGIGQSIREQRAGAIPESQIRRELQKQERYDRQTPFITSVSLGPWFRENIGSAGAATYGMRLMVLESTTTLMASGTGIELKQGSPGRIIGGMLFSSATMSVQLDSGSGRPLSDVVLNTTNDRSIVYRLGWDGGIPFAAGQTIEPVIVADASFAPTTADLAAWLFIAWEEPS
jgi:hypothetical protein